MQASRLVVLLLVLISLSGCTEPERDDVGDGAVSSWGNESNEGVDLPGAIEVEVRMVAGPTGPETIDANDSNAVEPVEGASLTVRDSEGAEVMSVAADSDGIIRFQVPPGTYELIPQPVEGLMGTPVPLIIELPTDNELVFGYDTGIR